MHLHPFRASGGRRHWLQLWVLLLLVPACFALATMQWTIAAIAITLTFGLPLAIWLAVNVHSPSEFRALAPRAIRFAAGVSITFLGLVGVFVFSAALAGATVAAYVVTVGLTSAWGGTLHRTRPATTTAPPTQETPTSTDDEADSPTLVAVTRDEVRKMTDAELCHAWRRSFVALQRARGVHPRAIVVQNRQLLLDEVDERHPAGLRAWLSSGARAAGGPDRFIGPAGNDRGHPEAA